VRKGREEEEDRGERRRGELYRKKSLLRIEAFGVVAGGGTFRCCFGGEREFSLSLSDARFLRTSKCNTSSSSTS
jgi:hypothetical protein